MFDFTSHLPSRLLEPGGVIVLYRPGSESGPTRYADSATFATIHNIYRRRQRYYLKAGRPLSREDVLGLAGAYRQRSMPVLFLPENVLAYTDKVFVFFTPSQRGAMHFDDRLEHLRRYSGKALLHPPLLWFLQGNMSRSLAQLRLWALPDDRRPTPETQLFQAPYFNASQERICMSAPVQDGAGLIERMSRWQDQFFETIFTHGTGTRIATCDYAQLLSLLAEPERTVFPHEMLVKTDKVLADVLR